MKIWNFRKFFIKIPSLNLQSFVKHAKWQIQRICIIVSLYYWPGEAAKQAASWFLHPSVCLGLTFAFFKIKSKCLFLNKLRGKESRRSMFSSFPWSVGQTNNYTNPLYLSFCMFYTTFQIQTWAFYEIFTKISNCQQKNHLRDWGGEESRRGQNGPKRRKTDR